MKMTITALGALAVLTGCAAPTTTAQRPPVQVTPGQPQPNELTIDTMGGGNFRGRAGSAWTREEVQAQAASMECGGKRPRAIDIQPVSGGGLGFSGRC
ncbi:hypothetical protein [Paracoccus zhejiangensis]|uniref:DUF4156 domain-containing protein n=1 Tax=Paracoccus zhejiangensis TaxID=1077935 RepID=A0A2H5EYQ9_9RHOB|nr:hypothetical protein [Paracoccus zhejiangensis]AUH64441.1 hypothetical protein CX676_09940 [Paracoccus zhejiangensis]